MHKNCISGLSCVLLLFFVSAINILQISLCIFQCLSNVYDIHKVFVIELTLGILSLEQIPSESSRSRISHAKMDGHSRL